MFSLRISREEKQHLTKNQAYLFILIWRQLFPEPHFYYPEGEYSFKHDHVMKELCKETAALHDREFFFFSSQIQKSYRPNKCSMTNHRDRGFHWRILSSRISVYLITWHLRQMAGWLASEILIAQGIPDRELPQPGLWLPFSRSENGWHHLVVLYSSQVPTNHKTKIWMVLFSKLSMQESKQSLIYTLFI